jgi:hypothetical protein
VRVIVNPAVAPRRAHRCVDDKIVIGIFIEQQIFVAFGRRPCLGMCAHGRIVDQASRRILIFFMRVSVSELAAQNARAD